MTIQHLNPVLRFLQSSTLVLPGLMVVAVLLRLPLLSGSFWLDEAAQALESVRPFSQQHQIAWDFHPPLFHYIVHGLTLIAHAEWWLRLSSLTAGIITIWATYQLCLKTSSKRVAFIAAFLLATSSFHIFYSQELRPYALATMFSVISWIALLDFVATPKLRQGSRVAIVSILGMYSLYLYPFLLLAQLLFVGFFHRQVLKKIVLVDICVALAFLPWVPSFLHQLSVGTGWATQVTGWSQIVATPQLKALPLVAIKFLIGPVEYRQLGVLAPLVWLLLAGTAVGVLSSLRNPKARVALFWLVVPILGAYLVSFVIPIIQPKRVLLCLPAFFIVLAIGIEELRSQSKKLALSILAALVLTNIASTVAYYRTPSFQREPWKEVVQHVYEDCNSSSCIVLFAFDAPFAPWKWYASSLLPIAHLDSIQVTDGQEAKQLVQKASDNHKVYLFDYLQDITDPQRLVIAQLESQGMLQLSPLDAGTIGFVRRFTTAD